MNATPFVRDFGLMPGLVSDLGFVGVARSIFLAKLGAIHGAAWEREQRKATKE